MKTRQKNTKKSPWNESGYARDTKKFFHRDGWCENFNVFKKFWDFVPSASFRLRVRNFNKIAGHITISIKFSGIGSGRLYFHNANLADFFPSGLVQFLTEEENNNKSISADFLVKVGDIIAKATGREFSITHQEGGDPEYAALTNYGPFYPNRFTSFDFDPKDTFVFLDADGYLWEIL